MLTRRAIFVLLGAAAMCAAAPAGAASFVPSRFSVKVEGNGPDVILIPGLTASRDVWRGVMVPGYRYHLVQVAGFAGEPARGNARGPIVAGAAEELSRYITAKGLRQPMIIGHSMGGTIGMMVAARHPAQVGRLMVVDMLPQPSGLFGSTPDRATGLANMLSNLSGSPEGRGLVASLMSMFGGGNDSDPDVVARAVHELAAIDLTSDLPKIRAPMTVVYAVPDAQSRAAIERSFGTAYRAPPGVKLVRVDGSGHMIMYDQPVRLRSAIAAFLRG